MFFKNYFSTVVLLSIYSLSHTNLHANEETVLDSLNLKETFILKATDNEVYENSPYVNILVESKISQENYDIDMGLVLYKGYDDTYAAINQMSLTYLGDNYELIIGKYVDTLGKLDYLSTVNIINPTNVEFFDDENINIRKIPLLMTELIYYPDDSWKLQAIVQPFNTTHQDYTSVYINVILNTLLPKYINGLVEGNQASEGVNEYVFMPVYSNYISPSLAEDIESKNNSGSDYAIDKLGGFLVAEYAGQNATYGAIWMNRHSEIPYIKVNEDVIDAIEDLDNPSVDNAINSTDSNNSDIVTGVDTYRYNQYNLYFESTLGEFGIRAETSFRDKIPVVNDYSWMSSVGVGVDYKSQYIYNNLELQWLHLDYNSDDVFAGVYSARSESFEIKNTELFLDYYLLFGYYDGDLELTSYPNITLKYEEYSLGLRYLYSKENSYLNNVSIILKAKFE